MKTSTQNVLSIISVVIPLLGFIFGDNIFDQIRKPVLTYSIDSINFIETEYYKNIKNAGYKLKIPDEIWEITLINRGKKAATNIHISIQYIGNAIEIVATSLENNLVKTKGESEVQISMDRMANNSTLKLKILFENIPSNLVIQYTDDYGARLAKLDEDRYSNVIQHTSIAILFITIIVIIYLRIICPQKRKMIDMNKKIEDSEKQKQSIIDENDDLKAQLAELETNDVTIDQKLLNSLLILSTKKKK